MPSPDSVSRASAGSISRQLLGCRPVWVSARTHSAPPTKAAEAHARRSAEGGRGRTRTHASVITPSVPSEPSSIRSGAGPAPEPAVAATPTTPRRRDHAHRLHEVVHVRVERGEVAGRARRDPAAERRELEALRVVAQREAVAASCASSSGPRRPPGCARRARRRRPRARVIARRSIETAPANAARRAARRRRRRSCRRHRGLGDPLAPSTTRAPARHRPRPAGRRPRPAGPRSRPPKRAQHRSRTCRARARRVRARGRADPRERRRRRDARGGQLERARAKRCSTSRSGEAQVLGQTAAAARTSSIGAARPHIPNPSACVGVSRSASLWRFLKRPNLAPPGH